MNHTMDVRYFARLVSMIPTADFDGRQTHPGTKFNVLARAGALDALDGDAYSTVLHTTNELGKIWHMEPSVTTGELIRRSFAEARLSEDDVRGIATILAYAYESAHALDSQGADEEPVSYPIPLPSYSRDQRRAMSPEQIRAELAARIDGQDEAVAELSSFVWEHLHAGSRRILIADPHVCGGLLLAANAGLINGTTPLVNAAKPHWPAEAGRGIAPYFKNKSREEAERIVMVVYNVDALFAPDHLPFDDAGEDGATAVYRSALREDLLAMAEGRPVKARLGNDKDEEFGDIDTKGISLIFVGAFEGAALLDADAAGTGDEGFSQDGFLRRAGVPEPLAERIDKVIVMRPGPEAGSRQTPGDDSPDEGSRDGEDDGGSGE